MNSATVPTVFAIMASAVIILGGLVGLSRAIWKAAQDIRDNKFATVKNTAAIGELSLKMDGRITSLETRVGKLEDRSPRQ
jgi:hypothetical protein